MKSKKIINERQKVNEWLGEEMEDRNHVLFSKLVPEQGPAPTVEGELLRAMNRLVYRYFNDGDYFYKGYGRETAGKPYSYLRKQARALKIPGLAEALQQAMYARGKEYEAALAKIAQSVLDYVESRADQTTKSSEDLWGEEDVPAAKKELTGAAEPEDEGPSDKELHNPYESIRENCKKHASRINERNWKYKIDLSFLENLMWGEDQLEDDQAIKVGAKIADAVSKVAGQVRDPGLSDELEGIASTAREAVDSTKMIDFILEELYDLGDEYDIWIATMSQHPGQEQELPEPNDKDVADPLRGKRMDSADVGEEEDFPENENESKKVNEDSPASLYHAKLWEFLDHPWQEDDEIELVHLIAEYKNNFKVSKPGPIQDYLKRLVQENNIMGHQGFSDEFMNQLNDLMEGDPSKTSTEASPDKVVGESKKLKENSEDDVNRFEEIIMEIAGLTEEAYNIIKSSGNRAEAERARSYWRGHIQGALGRNFSEYMGGSMHTMEDSLEVLQGGGEDEDIDDEGWDKTPPEGWDKETPEPEMEESVQLARDLLGLKEKSNADEPIEVGDLVQIADARNYRIEVEEAIVRAVDEKKGVEITGSTVPISQEWYGAPYWSVSVLEHKKTNEDSSANNSGKSTPDMLNTIIQAYQSAVGTTSVKGNKTVIAMLESYWGERSDFHIQKDGIYSDDSGELMTWEDEKAFIQQEVGEEGIEKLYQQALGVLKSGLSMK